VGGGGIDFYRATEAAFDPSTVIDPVASRTLLTLYGISPWCSGRAHCEWLMLRGLRRPLPALEKLVPLRDCNCEHRRSGNDAPPRLVIVAIVHAYALCRTVMCVARTMVSPSPLSLLVMSGETAAYIEIWVRRIVTVGVSASRSPMWRCCSVLSFGIRALVRLVMLTVHLMLVVVILQCRRLVADVIRSTRTPARWRRCATGWPICGTPSPRGGSRRVGRLALNVKNGYALLLQYFIGTAAVLSLAG